MISYRDRYFETHPIEDAAVKQDRVMQRVADCVAKIDSSQPGEPAAAAADPETKARFLYHRGRALNVGSEHSALAEDNLAKSVKLRPDLVEAWNELGECCWKRNDVDAAKTCFEGALKNAKEPNKVSLRNLSIVMRQKTRSGNISNEERMRNIEQGLSKAREAVNLDPGDGVSWSVLGNAHLMHFFSVSQNPRTLKQAMTAYKQVRRHLQCGLK